MMSIDIVQYETELRNPKQLQDHPFINKVNELFDHKDHACLVAEYAEGGDLS